MAEAGAKRILHCELLKIKELDHTTEKSPKKIEIKYEYPFKDDTENGKVTFYSGLYNRSENKSLKKILDTLMEGDEEMFTLFQTKNDKGFWDTDDIKLGHEGQNGLQGTKKGSPQSGANVSSGGGYDNDGARAGNLLTNTVQVLVASKAKDFSVDAIVEKAAELNEAAERIKAEVVQAGRAPEAKESTAGVSNVDLDDDDSDPFD
jgi:hypothetical protein